MFSFKKRAGETAPQEQHDKALECYLDAISAIEEHAVEISPELAKSYKLDLRSLHRALFEDLSAEGLEASRGKLFNILENYRAKCMEVEKQRNEDLQSMFGSLAMAAETMSSHNDAHSSRLKDFTDQLRTTACGTDLSQMKREVRKHVELLQAASQSNWRENNESAAEMRSRLLEFQERLENAEKRATTDALTGLLNRGEAESLLLKHVHSGTATSVLLLDLNRFKQINDTWGHGCGDQVLKVFSRNLERLVRPLDLVCRWGGDEFLIIVQCDEEIARQRAEELRELIRARYRIALVGKVFEVDVSASVGAAQALKGESVGDLLVRADLDMYLYKRNERGESMEYASTGQCYQASTMYS